MGRASLKLKLENKKTSVNNAVKVKHIDDINLHVLLITEENIDVTLKDRGCPCILIPISELHEIIDKSITD